MRVGGMACTAFGHSVVGLEVATLMSDARVSYDNSILSISLLTLVMHKIKKDMIEYCVVSVIRG